MPIFWIRIKNLPKHFETFVWTGFIWRRQQEDKLQAAASAAELQSSMNRWFDESTAENVMQINVENDMWILGRKPLWILRWILEWKLRENFVLCFGRSSRPTFKTKCSLRCHSAFTPVFTSIFTLVFSQVFTGRLTRTFAKPIHSDPLWGGPWWLVPIDFLATSCLPTVPPLTARLIGHLAHRPQACPIVSVLWFSCPLENYIWKYCKIMVFWIFQPSPKT